MGQDIVELRWRPHLEEAKRLWFASRQRNSTISWPIAFSGYLLFFNPQG